MACEPRRTRLLGLLRLSIVLDDVDFVSDQREANGNRRSGSRPARLACLIQTGAWSAVRCKTRWLVPVMVE